MNNIEFLNKLLEKFKEEIISASGDDKNLIVFIKINDSIKEIEITDFSEENFERICLQIENYKK